jgi:hypothetical protein
LQERFDEHLAQLEELTELEVERNVHNGHLRYLAEHYAEEFNHVRRFGKTITAIWSMPLSSSGFQQPGNHHLRGHPWLPAADENVPRSGVGPGSGGG